jgi:hypothetical protein
MLDYSYLFLVLNPGSYFPINVSNKVAALNDGLVPTANYPDQSDFTTIDYRSINWTV